MCLQRAKKEGEAGDAYAAMHRILRRGCFPEKCRSGGSRKLLGPLEGGLHAHHTEKGEMQSVLKSAVSGETRKGERAHTRKRGPKRTTSENGGQGRGRLHGMQGMHAASGRSEETPGGYAEARAWRGMREA